MRHVLYDGLIKRITYALTSQPFNAHLNGILGNILVVPCSNFTDHINHINRWQENPNIFFFAKRNIYNYIYIEF